MNHAALTLVVAACAVTTSACDESPSAQLVGTWTTAASLNASAGQQSWQFQEDGSFVFDDALDGRGPYDGWWELDGDRLRLEWYYGSAGVWPDERIVYVDGSRMANFAYFKRGARDGELPGEYETTWRGWNAEGALVEAGSPWLWLLDDGTSVYNSYIGTWTEAELDGRRAIIVGLELSGVWEEFRFFVVADGVLAHAVFERDDSSSR